MQKCFNIDDLKRFLFINFTQHNQKMSKGKKMKKKIFKNDNILFFVVLLIICSIANKYNSSILSYFAFFMCLIKIVKGSNEDKLCLIFFLIPNIRIFDCSGMVYLVNLLFVIGGIVYIINLFIKNELVIKKEMLLISVLTFLLCIMNIFNYDNQMKYIINCINMTYNIFLCFIIINNGNKYNRERIMYNMFIGILFSFIVYILSSDSFNEIFINNYRLSAYANDPNYFSCYLLFVMSYFSQCIVEKNIKNSYYYIIMVCFMIGLLTSSKMFVLLGIIIFFTLLFNLITKLKIKKLVKTVIFILLITFAIMSVWYEQILFLIDKVFLRFFTDSNSMTMSKFTTGRSDILKFYLKESYNSIHSLLLGRGIDYLNYYKEYGIRFLAHNTYMDFYLSWGIIGMFVVGASFIKTINWCKNSKKINLQFIIFLLSLMSLSCMSADMFWFLVAFVLMNNENSKIVNKECNYYLEERK